MIRRVVGRGHQSAITALFAVSLIGCIVSSPETPQPRFARSTISALGIFDDYNEILRGSGTIDPELHVQFYEFSGLVSGIRCVGHGRMTHMPSESRYPDHCQGIKGISRVTCTDGRVVESEYQADDSCLSGFGVGADQFGNTLSFVFGLPEAEAEAAVRAEMTRASKRKPLETYRPGEVRAERGYSTGTAFAVSTEGDFITSHHVVADADEIWLMDHGGNEHALVYVRGDVENDLALLRAASFATRPLPVRMGRDIRKGDEVLALGYPLVQIQGQELKATFGYVNALSGAGGDARFLQVDTPIQPGNSGGPLLDDRGNVVGVITATLDQVTTFRAAGVVPQNVNYALKTEGVLDMLESSVGVGPRPPIESSDRSIRAVVDQAERSVFIVVAH